MICSRVLAALMLTAAAASGEAADWRYSVGIHDFAVPDVNSDTYGINGSVSVDKHTDGGRHVYASAVVYVDYDQDDLDPSRIPIWWQIHAGTDGDFWQGDQARLGWTANVDTRINTASSIEREIFAMPALVAGFDTNIFAGLGAGVRGMVLPGDRRRRAEGARLRSRGPRCLPQQHARLFARGRHDPQARIILLGLRPGAGVVGQ